MRILQPAEDDKELYSKLKWLMFFRLLFTALLVGSTIMLHLREETSPIAAPLLLLYGLITAVFFVSILYAVLINRIRHLRLFAYIQISLDTFVVTAIIFVTGSFASIFSFLYLLVIIYASMLLYWKGSMSMAALCSIQYGIMIDLEFYGFLKPLGTEGVMLASHYDGSYVLYKIMFTMIACFAVASLSSFLSGQARKTQRELKAMERHVKRVEKLAAAGEMAAGLAHEIKNPLASLRSSIQLIRENMPNDSDSDKLMQIVMREADRLSSLVNSFLLFARPPAGKTEKIDLNKALNEIVELFSQDRACRGRITVRKNNLPGQWIEMDPTHMRQIFWNLLVNAAEAIAGTGWIEIRLQPLKGRQVGVQITDSGCGIPKDAIGFIFDPFFTTKANGTGLGLSIVHSILESYNSWLDVESRVNEGTTFRMKLQCVNPPRPSGSAAAGIA